MNSSSHDRTSELNRVIGLCRRIFDEYQLSYVEARPRPNLTDWLGGGGTPPKLTWCVVEGGRSPAPQLKKEGVSGGRSPPS